METSNAARKGPVLNIPMSEPRKEEVRQLADELTQKHGRPVSMTVVARCAMAAACRGTTFDAQLDAWLEATA